MDSSQREALPSDMVFEILSRTSLQTMDTCKIVCKEWNELMFDSTFMASYYESTGNLIGYMVQSLVSCKNLNKFVSPYKSERSFKFSPFKFDNIKIEASSLQGLFCCVRSIGTQYRYYVCKPCTNQWQALPNPKFTQLTEKTALVVMSSSPLRYKIIRVSEPRYSRLDFIDYRCQIFDSRTWEWKKAEDVILSRENMFDINPAICASGFACFLTFHYVLAFCVDQETPLTISLPPSVHGNHHLQFKKIIEYQGKIGLICEKHGDVELWTLKDWKHGKWEVMKRMCIDLLDTTRPSPANCFDRGIALTKTHHAQLFWDLKDVSFIEIQLSNFTFARDVFPFRSDWEPVHLRKENFSMNSKKKFKKRTRTNHMSDVDDQKNLQSR